MNGRKLTLFGFTQLIHHHLLWFLISSHVIAALFPMPGLWIRSASFDIAVIGKAIHVPLLLLLLAMLMFNAGLGLKTSHLRSLIHKAWVLIAGLAANLLIPIAYIFCVTLLLQYWHNPEEAQHILVGLALVAAMPIAGASTAWAQNSNGNLALSLGLVLFSTVISPIVTPVELSAFGEMASQQYETVLKHLAHYGSAAFLGVWVVLPALLGIAVRTAVDERNVTAMMPHLKFTNSLVLLLLNYSNAAVSLPQAVADHDLDFLALTFAITTGLCVTAFYAAYRLSALFKLDETERVSLMYGLGMNNNGTGLVLASLALPSYPRVMVPIIFYNLVQHLVAGGVHKMAAGGRVSAG